jgi:hypothetical protein
MDDELRKRLSEEARARARYSQRLEAAKREASGVRVIPLDNPRAGPKVGSFAEDMTPEERITERLPSQGRKGG